MFDGGCIYPYSVGLTIAFVVGLVCYGRYLAAGNARARADFAASRDNAATGAYLGFGDALGEPLAWEWTGPNAYGGRSYRLCAHDCTVARVHLTAEGALLGAEWSEGRFVAEPKGRWTTTAHVLRTAQSGTAVATLSGSWKTVVLPDGRRYSWLQDRKSLRFLDNPVGGTWRLQDSTGKVVLELIWEDKVINLHAGAAAVPDVPLLLVLGTYGMIFYLSYGE